MIDLKNNEGARKAIIMVIAVVLIATYLFFHFSSKKEETGKTVPISESSGNLLVENYTPVDKEFFENYDEKKSTASSNIFSGEETSSSTSDISSQTDDPDLLEIKKIQSELRERNQETKKTYNVQPMTNTSSERPQRVQQKQEIQTPPVQPVAEVPEKAALKEALKEIPQSNKSRFFTGQKKQIISNTVAAVVHGEQTVTNGSTLKLRLLEDMQMENVNIPSGTYIYGVVSIKSDRMNVSIQSIRIGQNIYSLSKSVFDMDGLIGINLPENIKAEIAKQATAESIREAEITSSGGNLLERGINAAEKAAKNLLSSKAKEIKVTIKANYKILLK